MNKNVAIFSIAGIAAILAIFFTLYFGSPYMAAGNLIKAARAGDKDKLEALVDFPAVKDSLKQQLTASLTKAMTTDPEMKDNPFAGLAAMMIPVMTDKAVDAMVTPESLAKLAQARKPEAADLSPDAEGASSAPPVPATPQKAATTPAGQSPKSTYSFITVDRFKVAMASPDEPKASVALVFERRNLFGWKLIKVDIADFLDQAQAAKAANIAAQAQQQDAPNAAAGASEIDYGQVDLSTWTVDQLSTEWGKENEECSDLAKTDPDALCLAHPDYFYDELQRRGYCFGEGAPSNSERLWAKCQAVPAVSN